MFITIVMKNFREIFPPNLREHNNTVYSEGPLKKNYNASNESQSHYIKEDTPDFKKERKRD